MCASPAQAPRNIAKLPMLCACDRAPNTAASVFAECCAQSRLSPCQFMCPQRPGTLKCCPVLKESGHAQMERLLELGADANACDKRRVSGLHYACGQGRLEIVRFLWSRGAELDAEDPGAPHEPLTLSNPYVHGQTRSVTQACIASCTGHHWGPCKSAAAASCLMRSAFLCCCLRRAHAGALGGAGRAAGRAALPAREARLGRGRRRRRRHAAAPGRQASKPRHQAAYLERQRSVSPWSHVATESQQEGAS